MPMSSETQQLEKLCIDTIRTLSMDAVQKADSGHPGTPMALAPIAYTLYTRVMNHAPRHPKWPARDRFVLSCGHASMLLYSSLFLTGYDITLDDIKNFRQLGSPCAGHPEYWDVPGIETTTGPLGQGIATSVGMALGQQMSAARFNKPNHDIVDHWTYVICSDGDMQEGVQSEAASLAGHLGLGRLIVFYDDNHISIEGNTNLAFSEDVGARYEAYEWHVQRLGEDFSPERIEHAVAAAKSDGRPSLIIVRSHIAYGAPHKQDTAAAHGSPLGEEEILLTKRNYGWPSEEPFYVPDEALAYYRQAIDRGDRLFSDWQERFDAYRQEFPELAAEFDRIPTRRLPAGWDNELPHKDSDAGEIATRKASGEILQVVGKTVPELVGGAADLAPSTLTEIHDSDSVERGAYSGRNLHFGIREHAMGACVNGLTLYGFRGFGATFLIFSDYMKPAVRIAGLAGIPSIFVYTHDSIGLGEDGPTHQPIEQLAALRAMPNIYVVRPADFNETALAWQFALKTTDRPVALSLTRQGIPTLDSSAVPADAIERGAYILSDCQSDVPDLILMATGSEVHLCLEAAKLLADEGVETRVLSMPCLERFAAQDRQYRDTILPPACRARVAVEAASQFGWHRWVGDDGAIVAMTTFGASAPAKDVFKHFGFTTENVAKIARQTLAQTRENVNIGLDSR